MKYIHVVKWIHVGLPAWAYSAAFEDQDEAEKYVKRLKKDRKNDGIEYLYRIDQVAFEEKIKWKGEPK